MADYPDTDFAKATCRIGQGHECCRYLTMSPGGWSCEKKSSLKNYLDKRVEEKSINAQGDNCPGKDSRETRNGS